MNKQFRLVFSLKVLDKDKVVALKEVGMNTHLHNFTKGQEKLIIQEVKNTLAILKKPFDWKKDFGVDNHA